MAKLPDEHNPFLKGAIYEKLNLNPLAKNEEVKKATDKFSKSLAKNKGKDDGADVEITKKSLSLLKRNFTRVALNATILEEVELKTVEEYLRHLPNLKADKVRLPKLDLSQVHIEGQNIEISKKDFKKVETDKTLELNLEEIKNHIMPQKIDQHHYFET